MLMKDYFAEVCTCSAHLFRRDPMHIVLFVKIMEACEANSLISLVGEMLRSSRIYSSSEDIGRIEDDGIRYSG
jgi:hypothetical protein